MTYMDDYDKKIQEKMKQEGKIKITNFNKIVKKYFKTKYGKEGYFEFLHVEYEFYDEDYKIYDLNLGEYVSRPGNREIRELLPFFIEPNAIEDVRRFFLKIPGLININNLESEIISRLPNGVTFITDNKIKEILLNEGYEEPFFDHYFYSIMDYPGYNLYAKPIAKDIISAYQFIKANDNTNKQLEQTYLDGSLKPIGEIDTENFPQDVPKDKEICVILDDLLSKNQLPFRKVRYCILSSTELIYMTDYFEEYSYNDRKFIRCQATINLPNNIRLSNNDTINKNKFYWIEVKPNILDQNKILYPRSNQTKSRRKK